MVEKINSRIHQFNYNTINKVQNNVKPSGVQEISKTQPTFTAAPTMTSQTSAPIQIRTTLNSKEEKEK